MNKWIILFATMLIALVFAVTIGTTVSNPSTSNVLVSSGLGLFIAIGFFIFAKSDKIKPKKDYDGFEPAD